MQGSHSRRRAREDLVREPSGPSPGPVDQDQVVGRGGELVDQGGQDDVGQDPIARSQQVDLDQVGVALEHFPLLGLVGLAIGAPPLVRWAEDLDQRDELVVLRGVADLDEGMPDRIARDDELERVRDVPARPIEHRHAPRGGSVDAGGGPR